MNEEERVGLKKTKKISNVIAMGIRNAFEDWHGKGKLKQSDMKEFNTKVRNSVYTTLKLMTSDNKTSRGLLNWQYMMIPDYWEEPELQKEVKEILKDNEN